MKKRVAIALLVLCLFALLLYWMTLPNPEPNLIFVRYAQSEIIHDWYAELRLTNNTCHSIGYPVICWVDADESVPTHFEYTPEYFCRFSLPTGSNAGLNGVGLRSIVENDSTTQKASLKPGEFVVVNVSLRQGESPKQVGIYYYELADPANTFSGQLYRLRTQLIDRLKLKDRRKHEIWCPEMLSAPAAKPN